VRHLLKLSPEKWDEVAVHSAAAVVPDFRPRVWWCPSVRGGLLFACHNGAIVMDQPLAYVGRGNAEADDNVIPIHQLDPVTLNVLPKLKQQALQEWFAPGHSGWAVYWRDANDPLAQQMAPPPAGLPPPALPLAALGTPPPDMVMPRNALGLGTPTAAQVEAQQHQQYGQPQHQQFGGQQQYGQQQQQQQQQQQYGGMPAGSPHAAGMAPSGAVFAMPGGMGGMSAGMAVSAAIGGGLGGAAMAMHQQHAAMAAAGMSPTALQLAQQQANSMLSPTSGGFKGPSPFASQGTQSSVPTDAFPAWAASQPGTPVSAGGAGGGHQRGPSASGGPGQGGHQQQQGGGGQQQQQPGGGGLPPVDSKLVGMLPSLEMINTDDLPPIGANPSLFSLDSLQQMQMLGDLPSGGVGQLLGPGGRNLDISGAGSGVDRALSLKFSMSLDLAEAVANGSGGSGSRGTQ